MPVFAPQKIRLGSRNHNDGSQNRDHVERQVHQLLQNKARRAKCLLAVAIAPTKQSLATAPAQPVVQKPAVQMVVPELELGVDYVIKRVLERFREQKERVDQVDDEGHELERSRANERENSSCEKQGSKIKTQGCAVDQHADEHEADDVHLEVSPALQMERKVVNALESVFSQSHVP
ncbi:hypothetical protein KL930_002306 [Ogataea haglerorum]|uniref:Uncharacterized protein n=1 Tax=Ogataea haglerorum TaxID=1937702 RepID=A0ABQ7RM08_9ASCO|nr:hypothetical protein KL915_001198 [Ogataea haglerorum]KAG7709948.1 hypothetical protein KL914_000858 [Ogataea haglerorum]KAG7711271.1 hypothetical protein KL950_001237 [Ogataea haglerorum]KAG7734036.1 hypothetical protein KL948_001238 [Ogataea haglerorum]KAG7743919.1 hypothetical protein KL932_001242 [Ogataea haglerorum]